MASTCARSAHDRIGITLDERTRPATLEAVWRAFGGDDLLDRDARPEYRLPEGAHPDQSAYLTHPIFHMNRAESEMTRYMRRLADRDLALDRAMIPLGSCTMKLNATAEMMPITWPEFAEIHPFVPADQAQGYAEMIEDLSEQALCDHRLRRLLDAAELRRAGRVCRAADDPRLPHEPRRGRIATSA